MSFLKDKLDVKVLMRDAVDACSMGNVGTNRFNGGDFNPNTTYFYGCGKASHPCTGDGESTFSGVDVDYRSGKGTGSSQGRIDGRGGEDDFYVR